MDEQSLHSADELGNKYSELADAATPWTTLIGVDVGRTFSRPRFDSTKQQGLWRVLNAYAACNPDVGYCQGMNFVAGLLLLVSDNEEESFVMLAQLMDRHGGLSGFYKGELPLLQRYVRACDQMMKENVPDLRDHFIRESVQPGMYLTEWFLTLFINCFPLSMVLIMWDTIICEGLYVILKITASIFSVLRELLLSKSCEEIIAFFKDLRTDDDASNVDAIGHLLIRHTETVTIPEHILGYIHMDSACDNLNSDTEVPWVWESKMGHNTWLESISRLFTFGKPEQ